MCYECYEEAGKPTIINDKTKKAAELIKTMYEQEGCSVGGYAHIVTDDWNLDDDSVDWCIKEAEKGEYEHISDHGRQSCLNTLKCLKELTEDERYSALALVDYFIEG
jgi:uncharacterized Fe-S cluster-containing radical SAM superfamily protein